MIREGKVLLKVEVPKVVSSEMPVFYNPAMVVNRDISLLIVCDYGRRGACGL
jgi:tRNA (guanine26-N2/guanine27-N2)-dimethyltransferase